jgi:hypothetical protein
MRVGGVGRYAVKPGVVPAAYIDPDDRRDPSSNVSRNSVAVAAISGWLLTEGFDGFTVSGDGPFGLTLEMGGASMVARPGDFVVQTEMGFFPMDPKLFLATYYQAI